MAQDADLEYDPADLCVLLRPIQEGKADAVYGSRFQGGPRRVLLFWHAVGNKIVTLLSNMFTNLTLTGTLGVDFKDTSATLRFRDGRLTPNEFEIKSAIRPFAKATLDADAQILASLVILPFLRVIAAI